MTPDERDILDRYTSSLLDCIDRQGKAGRSPAEVQKILGKVHARFKETYFVDRSEPFLSAARQILTAANDVLRGELTRAEAERTCSALLGSEAK